MEGTREPPQGESVPQPSQAPATSTAGTALGHAPSQAPIQEERDYFELLDKLVKRLPTKAARVFVQFTAFVVIASGLALVLVNFAEKVHHRDEFKSHEYVATLVVGLALCALGAAMQTWESSRASAISKAANNLIEEREAQKKAAEESRKALAQNDS